MDLRKLREDRGLTQSQMSEILGCSQQHYSYIERGNQAPTADQMTRLYSAFGVSADQLGYSTVPTIRIVRRRDI